MSSRGRTLAFGSAAALVLAGLLSAALVSGVVGEVLTIALIGLGLAEALLLVFLEIGFAEERDLEHEEAGRAQKQPGTLEPRKRSRLSRRLRRPR